MLIGQDRFRAFVEVQAAPIDAVAAGAGERIGNRKPAVVCARKPAKGPLGVRKPDRVTREIVSRRGGIDRRPRLDRLLVERTRHFAMSAKAVGPHRTEVSGGRDLGVVEPTERAETALRRVGALQSDTGANEGLGAAAIVLGPDRKGVGEGKWVWVRL